MEICTKRTIGVVAQIRGRYRFRMEKPDPIVRKTVSLPASLWARIDDYQLRHRIKRDTAAVRQLLQEALDAADRQASEPKKHAP